MGLAFPLGLLAAALVAPLILLYVLKLRRREVIVPSTLPWRRVLEQRRANAPWERLRRHLLLLLQILALLLLVLAFAGPFQRAESVLAGDTVIVLDASASMGARLPGTGRTRFDEARSRISQALLSVEGGRRAALILAGPEPRVLAPLTAQASQIEHALARATLTEAPADLAAALELASSLARGEQGGDVLLVTDGAFDPTPSLSLALKRVNLVSVGGDSPADNAGIASLALRPVAGDAGSHELFVGLVTSGARQGALDLVVESAPPPLLDDSAAPDPAQLAWTPVASQSLVPEGGSASRLIRVAASPGMLLRVRLPQGGALEADDVAHLIVPAQPERRILLSSPSPFLLERALASLPHVRVDIVRGEPGAGDGHDAVVIDGPLPAVLPMRPLLAFGAPGPGAPRLDEPDIVRWDSRHPALRHARFDAVRVGSAWGGELPPGAEILVESSLGALAVTWPAPGGRALAFRFDLVESDLPLRITFPVLVADAIDWLTESTEQDGVLPTGRAREAALPGAESASLLCSDGSRRELRAQAGAVQVPPLHHAGLFLLVPEGGAPRLLASALLSSEESVLSPRGVEGLEERADTEGQRMRVPGRRHLWPLAVLLAIGVLLAEWGVHHRRRE